jgi:glycosyltransferase involved in cell wall biosynthesis
MAVYNPRLDWLEAQLKSIDAQAYDDLELLAVDDASPDVPHADIKEAFETCVKRVPYTLTRNAQNLGGSRSFALLTERAGDGAISYCDQDDIWLPDKTAVLADTLSRTGAALAYSDLSVIDADGRPVADSLTRVRRRLKHLEGAGLAGHLLFHNFTNGTAMALWADTAKAALPFVPGMFADHWLTLYAAVNGPIAYVPKPLVKYRLHGGNQSAVMAGVRDKRGYLVRRIMPGITRFSHFKTRFAGAPSLREDIEAGHRWFIARKNWFENGSQAGQVWRLRRFGKYAAVFELAAARLPEPLFMAAIRLVQRGIL